MNDVNLNNTWCLLHMHHWCICNRGCRIRRVFHRSCIWDRICNVPLRDTCKKPQRKIRNREPLYHRCICSWRICNLYHTCIRVPCHSRSFRICNLDICNWCRSCRFLRGRSGIRCKDPSRCRTGSWGICSWNRSCNCHLVGSCILKNLPQLSIQLLTAALRLLPRLLCVRNNFPLMPLCKSKMSGDVLVVRSKDGVFSR